MVAPKIISKFFSNFKGLHKGYTPLTRPEGFCEICSNAMLSETGDLVKRQGEKIAFADSALAGLGIRGACPFHYIDTSNVLQQDVIFVSPISNSDDNVRVKIAAYKLSSETFTISYSGAATCLLNFKVGSNSQWQLTITENGSASVTYNAGDGTEAVINSLNSLRGDVNAPGQFTMSAITSNISSLPAACFPLSIDVALSATPASFTVYYLSRISYTSTFTSTFLDVFDKNPWREDWVIPSFVNAQNKLFVAPSGGYLHKIEPPNANGLYAIRAAGVPNPPDIISTSLAAGALTGTYSYCITFAAKDAYGNLIESDVSSDVTVSPSAQNVTLKIPTIHAGSLVGTVNGGSTGTTFTLNLPFNTSLKIGDYLCFESNLPTTRFRVTNLNRATGVITVSRSVTVVNADRVTFSPPTHYAFDGMTVNGNQAGVNTITIDGSLYYPQVGDIVYFYDRSTSTYVERNITAQNGAGSTATTITVDGATVSVNDDDPISYGGRINIYRTVAGGTEKYFVAQIPTNPIHLTVSYTDSTTDAALGFSLIVPDKIPAPPPKALYAIEHQGLIVCTDGDNIFFSEPGAAENFPVDNKFVPNFSLKGQITGLTSFNGMLVVFKRFGRAYIFGSLADNSFTSQVVEDGIGCESHETIKVTPVGLIWLSSRGLQKIGLDGVMNLEFNYRLASVFERQYYEQVKDVAITNTSNLVLKRALALDDYRNQRYIIAIPAESGTPSTWVGGTGGGPVNNAFSKIYCYDYKKDLFTEWVLDNTLFPRHGIFIHKDVLYFIAQQASLSRDDGYIMQENRRGDKYDCSANVNAITFQVKMTADGSGEVSVPKKFQRFKVWAMQVVDAFTLTIKGYRNWSSSAFTTTSKTFSAGNNQSVIGKFRPSRVKDLEIEFVNGTLYEQPRLSGYEYETLAPYTKDMK